MSRDSQYPQYWKKIQLGELLERSKDKADPTEIDTVPYVGLEHISQGTGMLLGQGLSSEVKSAKTKFAEGDLLYGKLRPYLNKVWIASFDGVCSTDILVFPPTPHTHRRYLYYRLLSGDFVQYANANSSGVNHPRINYKKISRFEINLPPLPEQRRIVEKIEELFSDLDAGIADLKKTRKQLRRYRQSVLQAAVEGRLTEAWREEHETEPAEKLLERILEERRGQWEKDYRAKYEAKGKEPPSGWKKRYSEPEALDTGGLPELPEGWVWISLHSLCTWSNGNGLPKKDRDEGPFPVYGGNGITGHHSEYMIEIPSSVVVGRVGANCGNVHVAPPQSWVTDNAIYSTWKSKLVDEQFLLAQLRDKHLNQLAGGSGQPYISQKLLKSLPIALPPTSEQKQIADEIDRLLSVAENAAQTTMRELKRAARLRQSILKRAFSGKLVPSGGDAAAANGAGQSRSVAATEGQQIDMPF